MIISGALILGSILYVTFTNPTSFRSIVSIMSFIWIISANILTTGIAFVVISSS